MSTTVTPTRSLQQRLDALAKANGIRSARSQIKRDLKAGRMTLRQAFDDERCQTAKAWDLILALPTYGRVKVGKIIAYVRCSPSKTVGGLSDRQRAEILAFVEGTGGMSPQPELEGGGVECA